MVQVLLDGTPRQLLLGESTTLAKMMANAAANSAAAAANAANNIASLVRSVDAANGYMVPVYGTDGRLAFGVQFASGKTWIARPDMPAGSITYSFLSSDVQDRLPTFNIMRGVQSGNGWALPFYDANGRVACGLRPSGAFEFVAPPIFPAGTTTATVSRAISADNGGARANATYALESFIDGAGKSQFRVIARATGNVLWVSSGSGNKTSPVLTWDGLSVRYFDDATGAQVEMYAPLAGGPAFRVASLREFAAYGDSITFGGPSPNNPVTDSYLAQLATMIGGSGWTYSKQGISTQTSTEIAARQGGNPSLLTVTGNQIPASGPVTVTSYSIDLLFNVGSHTGTPAMTGTLAGIPGTLSNSSSTARGGTYTFTRTSAGSVTPCPANTPFIPDQGVADRGDIQILLYGHNNPDAVQNLADVTASVNYLTALAPHRRFIVLSVIAPTTATPGTAQRISRDAINAAYAAAYPNNYLSVTQGPDTAELAWLNATYGYTPDATDTTAIADGLLPPGLRVAGDPLHPNRAGQGLIARRIFNFITSKGWLL
jgi:lysophospholipase L1-like esterase